MLITLAWIAYICLMQKAIGSSWPEKVTIFYFLLLNLTRRLMTILSVDIAAHPESVNILEGIDNDIRTPDNLADDVHDIHDIRYAWLAPILPGEVSLFL